MKYKYDFHCHVHEGSADSDVKAKDYIDSLLSKGFNGLLVTDHDTYNGYRYIINNLNYNHFNILKGIEYSTCDAGHILIIMPDEYSDKDIEYKGAKLDDLIEYVHTKNGILGPAHPYSEPYLSIFNSKEYKDNEKICNKFDFIEVFNAGEKQEENEKALSLANKYNLFTIAGSDAHYKEFVGKAYVELDDNIKTNNELIEYIKKRKPVNIGGEHYMNIDRNKYDALGNFIYFCCYLPIIFSKNKLNRWHK